MVAMCGEVLNFQAFEATIGSSESVANALNLIGVTQLLKPQSEQGLPAFPLARNVLANNVVIQSDYAACIQTVQSAQQLASLLNKHKTRFKRVGTRSHFTYKRFRNPWRLSIPS